MSNQFFERAILNSPYEYPTQHWELDESGQPTQRLLNMRRKAEFITPIPRPRKQKSARQQSLALDDGSGLSTAKQQYEQTATVINELRTYVDQWRNLDAKNWLVTPETERLLKHWRTYQFGAIRPFFCQIEAVETAIWLSEVAPKMGKVGAASTIWGRSAAGRSPSSGRFTNSSLIWTGELPENLGALSKQLRGEGWRVKFRAAAADCVAEWEIPGVQ